MTSIRTSHEFAPVPNAFVEVAPATMIGLFSYTFGVGPQDPIYIRPGQLNQQDYLNVDGAEWLLYTRSVMSYRIEVLREHAGGFSIGGASLVVGLGDLELIGLPQIRDWAPFHLMSGNNLISSVSAVELPGLLARFIIRTASITPAEAVTVRGSIIVRGV